jgi:hypothetical protein
MAWAPIAMVGMSLVSGMMQSQQAAKAGAAARSAATQQAQLQIDEYNRQQTQIDQQAAQQKGDRAMQADRDASTLQVLMGERGMASNAQSRSMQELGYFEGMDISRIETNRKAHIAATESGKTAALMGMNNAITFANNQQSSAQTGAFLGTLSSAVQIGANDYREQSWEHIQSGGSRSTFEYKTPWQRL